MNPKAVYHNTSSQLVFKSKSALLILRKGIFNSFNIKKKYPQANSLVDLPVVAISESDLWNNQDSDQNWILTAGKIQNLRQAAKKVNGVEIPAGCTFSFWKQVGRPTKYKGYVIGRELREGCIVPSVGGGLCQLSNALYDAALKANFEIIERHRHTQVIPGSLAEQDRDATIKWNYVDLRFKAKNAFRIEATMNDDKLMVLLRGRKKINQQHFLATKLSSSKLNDCFSCENIDCDRHQGSTPSIRKKSITAYLINDKWPEFEDYVKTNITDKDVIITSANKMKRKLMSALFLRAGKNVFSTTLKLDKIDARAIAKNIPIEATHLVVSQSLLPFLWNEGVFGGRTFDVLMTRLPIQLLQQRLDKAYSAFPQSKTLNDFRAPKTLGDLENSALTRARHIITPHLEVAKIFNNKAVKLEWSLPSTAVQPATGNHRNILFPASALGRKGAYEMRQLIRDLNINLHIAGKASEADNFWDDCDVSYCKGNPLHNIAMVVYPAYVEHQPRLLLKAISAGIPVITTTACGLDEGENIVIVPLGDYDALKAAVKTQIDNINNPIEILASNSTLST